MSTDLQEKFADALRKEYAPSEAQQPSITVAPNVSVSIVPPETEVEVYDLSRLRGAYRYALSVKRDHSGLIVTAEWTPVEFVPIERIPTHG